MAWSLANMIGQEDAVRAVAAEFASGRQAHAYMLEGQPGTGKLTMARGIAALRFCQAPDPQTGAACGQCRPCTLLARGTHSDYLELPRQTGSKRNELTIAWFVPRPNAAAKGIDTPVLDFLTLVPIEGDCRVVVIPDADRMTDESANAFLKTLEEPKGSTLFVLTTANRDRIPATIASRCRRVGLRPMAPDRVASELVERGLASPEDAAVLAEASEGSLGLAADLASEQTIDFWRWLETEAFVKSSPQAAQDLADHWKEFAIGEGAFADNRRALEATNLICLSLRRHMRRAMSPAAAAAALTILLTAADQLTQNVSADLVILSASFDVMAALK